MTYYRILGLKETASFDDITSAFRRLAKIYHPDINNAEDARSRFIEIYEAYSILKDSSKRQFYDSLNIKATTDNTNYRQEESEYKKWKNNAQNEANMYSRKQYKEFKREVLDRLKSVAWFSGKILYYFVLLLVCGLASIILRLILQSFMH